jgi:hypothetical protein
MKKHFSYLAAVVLSISSTLSFAASQSFWAYGNDDNAMRAKVLSNDGKINVVKDFSVAYEIGSNWTNISAKLWLRAVDDSFNRNHCTGFSCADGNGKGQDDKEQAVITKIESDSGSFASMEVGKFEWYDLGLNVTKYLLKDLNDKFTATVGSSLDGDFYFKNAKLVIDYDLKSVPVPAAVWLFIPALIGLIGLKRRV